jgi:hypothetical protein
VTSQRNPQPAFEEWLATKLARKITLEHLEGGMAPQPFSKQNSLSGGALEHYWKSMGQVVKHVNLLWKTKWIKWSKGFKTPRECTEMWQTLDPVSLDSNFSVLIPALRKLLSRAGDFYKVTREKYKEALLEKLEASDNKKMQKLSDYRADALLRAYKPKANDAFLERLLQRPKYCRSYFSKCGLAFSKAEIKVLCMCFASEDNENQERSRSNRRIGTFNFERFIHFIDDANLDDFKPASTAQDVPQPKASVSEREEYNFNDAIGLRTTFIIETFLERLDVDSWLGEVGFLPRAQQTKGLSIFVRADGQKIVYKQAPEEGTGSDGEQNGSLPLTVVDTAYKGWSWHEKRDKAVRLLNQLMKDFAADVLESHLQKRLEHKKAPARPVLSRHFVLARDKETVETLEGQTRLMDEGKEKKGENPEEDIDLPQQGDSLVLGDLEQYMLDQSTMLCLRWNVDAHTAQYRLEQRVANGLYTICVDGKSDSNEGPGRRPQGAFDVLSLQPNTRYDFRLTAYNKNGSSSCHKSFWTLPAAPAQPRVFTMVYGSMPGPEKYVAMSLCWGMSVYRDWIEHLETLFGRLRTDNSLKELTKEYPIVLKFCRHCQREGKKSLVFDDFKAFCAFSNYGLSEAKLKRYEQRKQTLANQLTAPDLGIGCYYAASSRVREERATLDCQVNLVRENAKPVQLRSGAVQYEVWCKELVDPTANQGLLFSKLQKGSSKDLPYSKVWEGMDDACSIVHLKPGCTYSFYVRAKNPMGESGNKSGSIPVFVEKPSAANNDTKVMFPKRFSENPRLSVPPIPAIVTRTSSEAVVLLQQSADHNGGQSEYTRLEMRLVCTFATSGAQQPNPERWKKVAQTSDKNTAVLLTDLKQNAMYQFRALSVDENMRPGKPSKWASLNDLKELKKNHKMMETGRSKLSVTFTSLVVSPMDLCVGDSVCFVESSRMDGNVILAARLLRERPAHRSDHSLQHGSVNNAALDGNKMQYVVEVLWASRLRKGVNADSFIPEKSLLGPQPFTPGYHSGSMLFRSPASFFSVSHQVYRARWVDEEMRSNALRETVKQVESNYIIDDTDWD